MINIIHQLNDDTIHNIIHDIIHNIIHQLNDDIIHNDVTGTCRTSFAD